MKPAEIGNLPEFREICELVDNTLSKYYLLATKSLKIKWLTLGTANVMQSLLAILIADSDKNLKAKHESYEDIKTSLQCIKDTATGLDISNDLSKFNCDPANLDFEELGVLMKKYLPIPGETGIEEYEKYAVFNCLNSYVNITTFLEDIPEKALREMMESLAVVCILIDQLAKNDNS